MPHLSRLNSLALTIALVIGSPMAFAAEPSIQPAGAAASTKAPLPLEELRTFAEVMDRIKAAYVEPVDDKTLLENAIKGMLSNLDPHSAYLGPEDFAELQESTSGEFGGLGIEVGSEDGKATIRMIKNLASALSSSTSALAENMRLIPAAGFMRLNFGARLPAAKSQPPR